MKTEKNYRKRTKQNGEKQSNRCRAEYIVYKDTQ